MPPAVLELMFVPGVGGLSTEKIARPSRFQQAPPDRVRVRMALLRNTRREGGREEEGRALAYPG